MELCIKFKFQIRIFHFRTCDTKSCALAFDSIALLQVKDKNFGKIIKKVSKLMKHRRTLKNGNIFYFTREEFIC